MNDDDISNAVCSFHIKGAIDVGFKRRALITSQAFISRNDQFGLTVDNAIAQTFCRKTTEYHRMHRPNTRARQHPDYRLRNHGHIQRHTIAFFNTQFAHGIT